MMLNQNNFGSIMFKLTTPVVFLIFNRPETTKKVFEQIRKAKPSKLFIIADGARSNVAGEEKLCKEVKSIVENIDWDCIVYKDYATENLGCKDRPATGLKWVFQHTDKAIILEDDCLPHPSFFKYCQELLEYYKDDERVNIISGSNFFSQLSNKKQSYYFSIFHHFWGWATWKRSWYKYDIEMSNWPRIKAEHLFAEIVNHKQSAKYWVTLFDEVYTGKLSSAWDYQWIYSSWINNGLAIIPSNNLISNIGFGEDATHTKDPGHIRANVLAEGIEFPLIHPSKVERNLDADMHEADTLFRFKGRERIIRIIKKMLRM